MSSVEDRVERLENASNFLSKSVRRWRISAFIVCAVISLSGCNQNPNPTEKNALTAKIGKDCFVEFRRGDGLGAACDIPVPPMTDSLNGADTQVKGKLESVSDGWVVLAQGDNECWIPRESILLIKFRK